MTRETKLGLLVGMAMVVFICILVSDYLNKTQDTSPRPDLTQLEADGGVPPRAEFRLDDPAPAPRETVLPGPGDERLTADAGDGDVAQRAHDNGLTRLTVTDEDATSDADQRPTHDVLINSTRRHIEATPQPGQPRVVVHHVQPGERLWDIAVQHYGDGNYYRVIYEANKDKMTSPNHVRQGVRLVIPQLNPTATDAGAAPIRETAEAPRATPPGPTTAPQYIEYTIKPGDALSRIAERFYGTASAMDKLLERNADRIRDPDLIAAGQKILVPNPQR